jgi:transcription elongation factor Elf1
VVETPNRRKGNMPVWNEYKFQCPGCTRTFQPVTIRIKRYNGDWYCHRCEIALTANLQQVGRPVTAVTSPSDALRAELCHTCGQPFGSRRIVVNTHGYHVHYRCPKKRNQN